jgi:hypothetical protein
MGNRTATEARNPELLSIFDIAAMILHGKIPASISVPVCLDELIDWTEEAMTTASCLAGSGAQVLPPDCDELVLLQPLLRRVATDGKVGSDEIVCQNEMTHFPDSTLERAAFYDKHILVYIEAFRFNLTDAKPTRVAYSISGLDFCLYLRLLRRLSQLSELGGVVSRKSNCHEIEPEEAENLNECKICMARPQETVLPCLHGVCAFCEEAWVKTHMACPFCRRRFINKRRRKREQWQVRTLLSSRISTFAIACSQTAFSTFV